MEITNARRIICLGAPDCQALKILKDLTGSAPSPADSGSIAGLAHTWDVKTSYYSANIPIWLDEITSIADWRAEFIKAEAKQVVDAIGAWVFCFTDSGTLTALNDFKQCLDAIHAVVEHHLEGTGDAIMLAVANSKDDKAMSDDRYEALEDVTIQHGFELIDYAAKGINDYGEKQGLERLKEALETNEWSSADDPDGQFDEDFLDGNDDFTDLEEAEMSAELYDLKASLVSDETKTDQAEDEGQAVDDLEAMLGKLLAVKEQSTDLPLAQRRRIAARAVHDVMQQDMP